MYLWARYGDQRLQAEQTAGRVGPVAAEQLRRLAAVLREASERFVATAAVASAERRLAVAREFRRRLFETRRPVLVEQAMAELRSTVSTDGL